jgi:tetratricopeptide (TPR) repeat protein
MVRRGLSLDPVSLSYIHDLTALALVANQVAAAVRGACRLIAVAPDDPGGRRLYALALLHLAEERHAQTWRGPRPWEARFGDAIGAAAAIFSNLIATLPNDPTLRLSFAAARQAQGQWRAATQALRTALVLMPSYVEALNNLGGLAADRIERDEAEVWLVRALAATPDYAEGWNNLASLRLHAGKPRLAASAARQALRCRPGWAEPSWNLALALLTMGELSEGFRLYEARYELADKTGAPRVQRRWHGEALPAGSRIVVRAEQGYGDMLQFARYLAPLRDRGLGVILECQPALAALLSELPEVERVAPLDGPFPNDALQVAIVSLPVLAGTRLESIPARIPYLAAPSDRRVRWHDRLASIRRPRIGLNWHGNPAFNRDRERSPGFAPFRHLLGIAGIRFFGLAREPTAEARTEPSLVHVGPDFADFSDAAACLEELDLVITSDTAIAHLAGALGRPTWLLLHHAPDWRWLESRTDSPWYPSLRLFRQSRPGDWTGVLHAVERSLRAEFP